MNTDGIIKGAMFVFFGNVLKVDSIHTDSLGFRSESGYSWQTRSALPIPITNKILEENDFTMLSPYFLSRGNLCLYRNPVDGTYSVNNSGITSTAKFRYIHELQLLIYALEHKMWTPII